MLWHRRNLANFSLLFIGASSAASSSQRGGGSNHPRGGGLSSPVRELGPSLAASVAGGTVIAARSPRPRRRRRRGRGRRRQAEIGEAASPVESGVDCDDDVDDDEDDGECLVVLFRSPVAAAGRGGRAGNLTVSSVFGDGAGGDGRRPDRRDDDPRRRHRGLSFLPEGPVHFPFPTGGGGGSGNLRVLHAPSGLLVAATGFAPDADHLLGVAAGRVLSRMSVYDSPSSRGGVGGGGGGGGKKSVDPHRLVREDLSATMIDAAMSDGGRPLGLQLLVVGTSALSSPRRRRTTAAEDGIPSLEVYTVDPSGGWRSCAGSGTAVGRGAEGVRSSLRRRVEETRDSKAGGVGSSSGPTEDAAPLRGWRGALDKAMMASVIALDRDDGSPGGDDNDADERGGGGGARANYRAVVVFGPPPAGARDGIGAGGSRCATVGPAITEECYERCRRRLADRKKLAG